ncbi:hypothetical protein QF034_000105 [Streptomyces africanus]|uniref:Integrase catalytic domain-containing protein n=1 Tax=Streptomyces africanus TaxID=231024 RepID=A0ABU0QH22_9ACTN|nr:hypothetical protein [Streptomyces africanus]
MIAKVAVTPHEPARDAVLVALRTGISRAGPYGPCGGLPTRVRVDRGKEFLCKAVSRALGGFAVPVEDLPAYKPYRKGTIEALNSVVEETFLVSLPGYTRRARPAGAYRPDGPRVTLSTATFEGRLRVTDPDTLRASLLGGIGPAKGYGQGLLTLAPLHTTEADHGCTLVADRVVREDDIGRRQRLAVAELHAVAQGGSQLLESQVRPHARRRRRLAQRRRDRGPAFRGQRAAIVHEPTLRRHRAPYVGERRGRSCPTRPPSSSPVTRWS